MRVYKENRTNAKTGKKTKSKNWYIDFIDHHNQRHYLAAFSDKKLSYTLADKIEALISCRVSSQLPGPELQVWIDRLANRLKENFRKWGLLDGCRVAATKLLAEHLQNWRAALTV